MARITWKALEQIDGVKLGYDNHLEEKYAFIHVENSWEGITVTKIDGEFHICCHNHYPIGRPLKSIAHLIEVANLLGATLKDQ